MESSGVDGPAAALSGPMGPDTAPFRPENGARATSQTWAAVLCFVAAIGAALSAALGVVAAALVSASIAAVSEHLPDDTKSTISELASLNWAAAGAGVLIAAAFVVGGIAILRRKPASRAIVTATCSLNVLAAAAVYLIGRHIWAGIDDAMRDVTSVEVTHLDPGLAGVIAKCLLAAVILVLVFWTSIRPSRVQANPVNTAATVPTAAGAGPNIAVPASKGTAVTSAVLSLVGGSLCAIGAIACLIGALNSELPEHERIISVIVGAPAVAFTAALITGGALLLRRHVAGTLVLAITWTLIILLAGGLLFAVARNPNRPTGALGWVTLGVLVVIGYAATAATLALAPSTQRWCRTKNTAHQAIPASAPESTTVAPTFQAQYGRPAYIPSPQPTPVTLWWQKGWVIASSVGVAAVSLTVAVVLIFTTPTHTANKPVRQAKLHTFGEQIVLPFPERSAVYLAQGIAVDDSGTVYIAYSVEGKAALEPAIVRSLPPGATASDQLPAARLPRSARPAIAVDREGTLYMLDWLDKSVVALRKDTSTPSVLPFGRISGPSGVAVDDAGTVYVANTDGVLALHAGASAPIHLPFNAKGIEQVAVGPSGTVYARYGRDQGGRVVALTEGDTKPTELPFNGLSNGFGVGGIAVDRDETVYIADTENGRILALPAGSSTQTAFPISAAGSTYVQGVAVDGAGNLYAYGSFGGFVIKLPVTG